MLREIKLPDFRGKAHCPLATFMDRKARLDLSKNSGCIYVIEGKKAQRREILRRISLPYRA